MVIIYFMNVEYSGQIWYVAYGKNERVKFEIYILINRAFYVIFRIKGGKDNCETVINIFYYIFILS